MDSVALPETLMTEARIRGRPCDSKTIQQHSASLKCVLDEVCPRPDSESKCGAI